MSAMSVIVGGIASICVLIASFLLIGSFSIQSGISPFLLSITTFLILTIVSSIYLALAKIVFPAIYTRTSENFKHIMIFMIILYFCLLPVYMVLGSDVSLGKSPVLLVYLFHIILAVFGIELILVATNAKLNLP